jgi:tetratricopeptide (TPR) repeat protein
MKKIILLLLLACSFHVTSMGQDANRLHELGKNYMIEGDYVNAESLLYEAYQKDTANLVFAKDLTLCLYFQKELKKALKIIVPKIENGRADDQCFQIAGNIYRALKQYDQMEQLYKLGLKKFPNDGALYNEMGELMAIKKNESCITFWEKGIEKDPAYPRNYFNACRYYAESGDISGLWYGEMYVTMDPFSTRSSEMKEILLRSYKNFFAIRDIENHLKDKSKFEQKVGMVLHGQIRDTSEPLTAQSLIMFRAGFLLDWFAEKSSEKYPHQLFDRLRFMLREGMFEAYNQWLFVSAENLTAFQTWTQLHQEEYERFLAFIKKNSSPFPKGQYYK